MTSDDIYVRKDVYEADQRAIIAELQRGNAELLRVIEKNNSELLLKLEQYRNESKAEIEQFKGELSDKLEQYRNESKAELQQFKGEVNGRFDDMNNKINVVNGRIDQFRGDVNSRFDKLEARVVAHEEKMEYLGTALNDRISDTHTYIAWGFTILGIVVAIAVVLLPVLKLFKAIKEIFKPSVTVEKMREIAREEIAKVLPQVRQ